MKGSDRLPEIDLERHLRDAIGRVPPGSVVTCGALALALGDRAAARWIGSWALRHKHDAHCACHRIVRADGRLGGYPASLGGMPAKIERLAAEGIRLTAGKIDLARYA
ncbi:MAG: MGMT family protein, partial [Planctomycetota bacterium]